MEDALFKYEIHTDIHIPEGIESFNNFYPSFEENKENLNIFKNHIITDNEMISKMNNFIENTKYAQR